MDDFLKTRTGELQLYICEFVGRNTNMATGKVTSIYVSHRLFSAKNKQDAETFARLSVIHDTDRYKDENGDLNSAVCIGVKSIHELENGWDYITKKSHEDYGYDLYYTELSTDLDPKSLLNETIKMTPEAIDFKEECDAIEQLLLMPEEDVFDKVTLFKNWTIGDIIGHLHLWNIAADETLNAPERFQDFITMAMGGLMKGGSHQALQKEYFGDKSHRQIYEEWRDYYPKMASRFNNSDPEFRVKWAGPDMSVKSCIIARQMEHWAHAQAIFDVLGVDRVNGDRLKNVAHIGVTTYSWSFKVNGRDPIKPKPYVRLTAPSGAIWEWNKPQEDNKVEGSATEFSQVVTQCRNIKDTSLEMTGVAANEWMAIAQCFAGGKETPPAKGARRKA